MRVNEKEREKEKERERKGPQSWESDLLISGAVLLGKNRVAWVELLKAGSQKSGLLCPDAPRKGAVLTWVQIEDAIQCSSVAQSCPSL